MQHARGLLDKVADRNPSRTTAIAMQSGGPADTAAVGRSSEFLKRLLHPYSLGLMGLAIAIVLWGTGYKLSLYCPHPAHSSRVPVAKLWTEPRTPSVDAISGRQAKSHLLPGPQIFLATYRLRPSLNRSTGFCLCRRYRGITSHDFLIPFRSPPTHSFC